MQAGLLGRRCVIGVDRLDYSKGLVDRFHAYERFMERHPAHLNRVTFLQIAPLSRADVRTYAEIRRSLEQAAGRINGRFAETDWTPIRYLNRNFSHEVLMGFLRNARRRRRDADARRHEPRRQGVRRGAGPRGPRRAGAVHAGRRGGGTARARCSSTRATRAALPTPSIARSRCRSRSGARATQRMLAVLRQQRHPRLARAVRRAAGGARGRPGRGGTLASGGSPVVTGGSARGAHAGRRRRWCCPIC